MLFRFDRRSYRYPLAIFYCELKKNDTTRLLKKPFRAKQIAKGIDKKDGNAIKTSRAIKDIKSRHNFGTRGLLHTYVYPRAIVSAQELRALCTYVLLRRNF